MTFFLNPAGDQLHLSIKNQQITQHPWIQVDAGHYTIDSRWFTLGKLCPYIQSLKLRQQEIVCYVLTDTLHFQYQELEFAMLFFHEAIFCDLYPAVLEDAWLKEWKEDIQAILIHQKNDIVAVQTVFSIWSCSFMMHWYKTESSKIIGHFYSLALCTQGNWCEEL